MDGFRFDLMGLLDVELMENIRDAQDWRFGKCEKLLCGELWAGGVQKPAKDCVTLTVDNSGGDSPWVRLFLAYSARSAEFEIILPDGDWELLADGASSFLWKIPEVWTGRYPMAPVSAAIFGQRKR